MDEYISVQDYAEQSGKTTQAVYKQLKTHEKELQGHIIKQSGKRYLDAEAVKILDSSSRMSAPVLVDTADKAKLEQAQERINTLENELKIAQERLSNAQETIITLQQEKIADLGIIERSRLLLEDKERMDAEIQQIKSRNLWQRIFNKD